MKFKNGMQLWAVVLAVLIGSSICPGRALAADPDLEEVRAILRQNYVTELSEAQLQGDSVEEILRNLDDPYTTLFNEEDYSDFNDFIEGNYAGIGIVIEEKGGYIEIVSVFEGSPAQQAGLQSQDMIRAVDNTDLAQMPQEQAVKLIRGEPGTPVSLKVERDDKILHFIVTREEIDLPVVGSEMLADHILYLKISSFASNTADLVQQAIVRHPDTAGIILDLRDNGGGYVLAAYALGQEFLDPGTLVWLQNRAGLQPLMLRQSAAYRQPMVLLVNQGSASAAEIIAGAFQDRQRAVLVGETTFGKFCVQSMVNLGNGYILKYTTDYFLTPAQRQLDKIGVEPDIAADDQKALAVAVRSVSDQQLMDAAYDYLLTVDIDDLTAYVNGKKQFDGRSRVKNEHLYLNLQDVAREIGLSVWWDEERHKVMVQKDGPPAEIGFSNRQAFVEDGRTYVSMRELGRIIGGYVDYHSASQVASLQWN